MKIALTIITAFLATARGTVVCGRTAAETCDECNNICPYAGEARANCGKYCADSQCIFDTSSASCIGHGDPGNEDVPFARIDGGTVLCGRTEAGSCEECNMICPYAGKARRNCGKYCADSKCRFDEATSVCGPVIEGIGSNDVRIGISQNYEAGT